MAIIFKTSGCEDERSLAALFSEALNLLVSFEREQIVLESKGSARQTLKGVINAKPLTEFDVGDPLDIAISKMTDAEASVWRQDLNISTAKENLEEMITDYNALVKRAKREVEAA